MTIELVTEYLDKKIAENEEYIACSVYDIRVNQNIAEKNIDRFLKIAKKRLEKLNYQVYFTGANYSYNGEQKIVETNKYMVAIKNKEDIKN